MIKSMDLPLHQEADRIKDNMGNHICYLQRPVGHTARAGMLISCERAKLIVRACNSQPALLAACKDIEDGPDDNCAEIHLTDNYQQGLFCGLEDKDIVDRYEACMYGFEKATERVIEWAQGMVEAAVKAAKEE